jgi:hypothetical protein
MKGFFVAGSEHIRIFTDKSIGAIVCCGCSFIKKFTLK